VPFWVDKAKVHPDHHVQVAHALYSVPTRHVGKTVRVRLDRTTVRIFLGAEMIKMHGRVGPGQRSTDVYSSIRRQRWTLFAAPQLRGHSYLRASIGFRPAARRAGKKPKMTPIAVEKRKDSRLMPGSNR